MNCPDLAKLYTSSIHSAFLVVSGFGLISSELGSGLMMGSGLSSGFLYGNTADKLPPEIKTSQIYLVTSVCVDMLSLHCDIIVIFFLYIK